MSNEVQPDGGDGEPRYLSSPTVSAGNVTAALRHLGLSSRVTACTAVEQLTENHLYEINLDNRTVALRVWAVASPAEAHAQITLERRLASCGLPVPGVLLPSGPETLVINGQPAAVLERHEGRPGPNYTPGRVTETYATLAEAMARTIATMHVSALGLEALDYREAAWLKNLGTFTQDLDFSDAADRGREVVAEVESAATSFKEFCDEAILPTGVVHGSPGAYSVLVDDDGVRSLFDLGAAHCDLLVLDVAHIVSQWGVAGHWDPANPYRSELVRRIVDGYCAVRPLSGPEREALAMAVPLRYAIDWLRIWTLVGEGKTSFSWEEYLDAFAQLGLVASAAWRSLFESAAVRAA